MQNKIEKPDLLLNENGELKHKGWATKPLLKYNRENIKASKLRIKEWDYYCILNNNNGIAFTIADNGYLGFIGVTLFDFTQPSEITKSIILPFTMGKLNLPRSSETGDIRFRNKKISMEFIKKENKRIININYKNFSNKNDLIGSIELTKPDSADSMVIATPFKENPKAFYYNQKINCLVAKGELKLGNRPIIFSEDNSFGVLDWERGVWTYSNTWYWGSASGKINYIPFGFNIGYGFGDTSAATENMIFYDGKVHKLDKVTFNIPSDNYLKPWKCTSNDNRFEMDFVPILDRHSNTNLLIIKSDQHQVFGKFSGKAVLDTGKEITVKDLIGFAEKVVNRW